VSPLDDPEVFKTLEKDFIKPLARKMARQHSLEQEDIEQELWVKCCEIPQWIEEYLAVGEEGRKKLWIALERSLWGRTDRGPAALGYVAKELKERDQRQALPTIEVNLDELLALLQAWVTPMSKRVMAQPAG
jgi:hypothetical protein